MQQRSFVGLRPTGDEDAATPTGRSTPNTKHRRQLQTFVADIRIADRVVVPTRDRLLVGEIVGDYEWLADAPEGCTTPAASGGWLPCPGSI